jgi:hypothetical protein
MMAPLQERTTWVVARLGATMHYAVPRILHRADRLERFYTDFYASEALIWLLSSVPKRVRSVLISRALGRVAHDLPQERVRPYPLLGLEYYLRRTLARDPGIRSDVFLWAGRRFGELVTRDGFGNAGAVYAFNTAAQEIFRAAKQQGLVTVLEQTIAPRALEEELLAEEHRRFPKWELENNHGAATSETIERERVEWSLADLIICGSEFVRRGVAIAVDKLRNAWWSRMASMQVFVKLCVRRIMGLCVYSVWEKLDYEKGSPTRLRLPACSPGQQSLDG